MTQQYRAKKSLGQNFLKSSAIVAKMIHAAQLTAHDVVLEVGPGKGVLTRALLETGCRVIAVEKDSALVALLRETFAHEIASRRLTLVESDILKFNPVGYGLRSAHYKLIANIPYYITGEILRLFLSGAHQPERMVLLVQKEVAQRIVARDGAESILSLSVKAFGTPTLVASVPKKYFSPAPKVDSAVLLIANISRTNFTDADEARFFALVKAGFAHKRKVLTSNLSEFFDHDALAAFLKKRGRDVRARAENLSLPDWLSLARLSLK
jgi:16S rRNA (adenine1518-N6/adenine1519-N6)-dimethyltransferase